MKTPQKVPFERVGDEIRLTLPPNLCEHLDLDDQETIRAIAASSGVLLKADGDEQRDDLSIFYELWAKSVRTLRGMGRSPI